MDTTNKSALRQIAESNATRLQPDPAYNNAAGVPTGAEGASSAYEDDANLAKVTPGSMKPSVDTTGTPFKLGG